MDLQKSALDSVKWSYFATLLPKIMTPFSVFLIARFLSPTAYGLIAIATFLIAFANIFVNAGFAEALIQADLVPKQLQQAKSVIFCINLIVAFVMVALLQIFAGQLACFFHKPQAESVIRVVSLLILLNGFIVVQNAEMQRTFAFKRLFLIQIWPSIIPFFVSLPLAYLGFGVWALVVGLVVSKFLQAITFYIILPWLPTLFCDWSLCRRLSSFGGWVLLEGIQGWLIVNYDVFVASHYFDAKQVGIYFFASNIIALTMGMVLSPLNPIIYAYLSRVDIEEVRRRAVQLIELTALVIVPIAIGLSVGGLDLYFLLGHQWKALGGVLFWLAISPGFSYIWGFFPDIYRGIGRPRINALFGLASVMYTVPMYWIAAHYGFKSFIYVRFSLLIFAFFHFYILSRVLQLKLSILLKPLGMPVLCACLASLVFIILLWCKSAIVFLLVVILFVLVYAGLMLWWNRRTLLDKWVLLRRAVP